MTAIEQRPAQVPVQWTDEQTQLLRDTIANGTTPQEFQLFTEVCRASGLNPFQRQIYPVMRWDSKAKKEKMVIQTGIDGYRLIAARTGAHLGTSDAEFGPTNKDGYPEWARVTARRLVHGHVAEFPATARWGEYVQMGKEGVTMMWKRMPHTMLAKCAEALALRKAFPAELSGVYTAEEMAQADNVEPLKEVATVQQEPKQPSAAQIAAFEKVQGMASRVRKVAPAEAVDGIMDDVYTDSNVEEMGAAYEKLVELGKRYAKPKPSEDVVDAELTPETIGKEKAAKIHKVLGAVLKDTEYEGDAYGFASEMLGKEVTSLSELTPAEELALSKATKAFDDGKKAADQGAA